MTDTKSEDLAWAVRERIAAQLRRPVESVPLDTPLADLVVDSIDLIEVAIDLQEEHDVWFEESDLQQVSDVADLVALIERRSAELTPS